MWMTAKMEWQQEEMDADDELNTLMDFVFGSDSSPEEVQEQRD